MQDATCQHVILGMTGRPRYDEILRSWEEFHGKVTVILGSNNWTALGGLGWETITLPEIIRTDGGNGKYRNDAASVEALWQDGTSPNDSQPQLVSCSRSLEALNPC